MAYGTQKSGLHMKAYGSRSFLFLASTLVETGVFCGRELKLSAKRPRRNMSENAPALNDAEGVVRPLTLQTSLLERLQGEAYKPGSLALSAHICIV